MRFVTLMTTAVSVLALATAGLSDLPVKVVYNGSASAPAGFYWIDDGPADLGEFVLITVPDNVREMVETRRYLPKSVPMIKRIVAVEGDEVCRKGHHITLNDNYFGDVKPEDRSGRPLPVWQGCRVLGKHEIFVMQFHPGSFDGRYFGPVDRTLIIGRAIWLYLPWRR